ncbi:Rho-binding antiterminator [Erwinia sp. HR93]|uniref:Rho-binding antiterminator n=1 Tax=Erwinia sp. HR93 TaxID=3094840 RepID=UPI002ADEF8A3|nr:Rho-binding antiterminator [Erwinia sp. HR93]MEA1063687.1 Rho-binding antiterminator [Erwinia sp. HR93]
MSTNDVYHPINCDDYDNLELACQQHMLLTLELKNGETLQAKADALVTRKNVEYLLVDNAGTVRELRLDTISKYSNPQLGEMIVSE